jgi:hypothetical protein
MIGEISMRSINSTMALTKSPYATVQEISRGNKKRLSTGILSWISDLDSHHRHKMSLLPNRLRFNTPSILMPQYDAITWTLVIFFANSAPVLLSSSVNLRGACTIRVLIEVDTRH